jgi:hypothetical protein
MSHPPHKKSDAEFRKELINADMGVFNKITKRQTAARKYKAEKSVTPSGPSPKGLPGIPPKSI